MRFFLKTLASCALVIIGYSAANITRSPTDATRILYSLDARTDHEIIRLIDAADRYAYFAIYTFTMSDIADAFMQAKRRGVDVRGIVDRGQSMQSDESVVMKNLRDANIPVITQKHPEGIMHLKLLVTEKAYAIGSYNWTWSATHINDEILEIGTDETARNRYLTILQKIWSANR